MKIIKELSEMIDDEIDGALCYSRKAVEWKTEAPKLADVLYELSREELVHVTRLHDEVVNLIDDYRKVNGEPPKEMLAIYDYLHKKQIEKVSDVKRHQDIFKTM